MSSLDTKLSLGIFPQACAANTGTYAPDMSLETGFDPNALGAAPGC